MVQVVVLPYFLKQLKPYAKKHRHLKDDLIQALEQFHPAATDHLGNRVYKIRIRSRDLARGKSKSFRVIALLVEIEQFLVPITICFKGDRESLTTGEINDHLEAALFELRRQAYMHP